MKRYCAQLPNYFYAITVYGKNKQDARKQLRKQLCVDRLPNGTTFWGAN